MHCWRLEQYRGQSSEQCVTVISSELKPTRFSCDTTTYTHTDRERCSWKGSLKVVLEYFSYLLLAMPKSATDKLPANYELRLGRDHRGSASVPCSRQTPSHRIVHYSFMTWSSNVDDDLQLCCQIIINISYLAKDLHKAFRPFSLQGPRFP